MSVISVICLYLKGSSVTVNPGVIEDRHAIVTVTVTEETPCLSGLLAGVTVMTLMTMECRDILRAVWDSFRR